ncbi:glycoside hydrolase family 3 N-terminal domain-containing protein [Shigella flexneri]
MVAVDQEGGRVSVFAKVLPAYRQHNPLLRCWEWKGRQTGARGGLAHGQRMIAMDDISFAPVLDVGHISAAMRERSYHADRRSPGNRQSVY